jgi:hypothetical protein
MDAPIKGVKRIFPEEPVTLTPDQLQELYTKLRDMNHDVRGVLAIIAGSLEVMRLYPDNAARFVGSLGLQPQRIEESLTKFAADFEQQLGIIKVPSDGANQPKTSA